MPLTFPAPFKLYDLTKPSTVTTITVRLHETAAQAVERFNTETRRSFMREGHVYFLAPAGERAINIDVVAQRIGPLTFRWELPAQPKPRLQAVTL